MIDHYISCAHNYAHIDLSSAINFHNSREIYFYCLTKFGFLTCTYYIYQLLIDNMFREFNIDTSLA